MTHPGSADTAAAPGSPTRRSRRRWFVTAGVASAALGAIVVPVAATSAAGGSEGEGARRPPAPRVSEWAPCPDAADSQCGTMQVPLDWSKPRGKRITVAVTRRPAGDPAQRIGTVFFNPGGPGDGAHDYIAHADVIFPDSVRARFDLVGLDPRADWVQPARALRRRR